MEARDTPPQAATVRVKTFSYLPFTSERSKRAQPDKTKKEEAAPEFLNLPGSESTMSTKGARNRKAVEARSGDERLNLPASSVRSGLYWAIVFVQTFPPPPT